MPLKYLFFYSNNTVSLWHICLLELLSLLNFFWYRSLVIETADWPRFRTGLSISWRSHLTWFLASVFPAIGSQIQRPDCTSVPLWGHVLNRRPCSSLFYHLGKLTESASLFLLRVEGGAVTSQMFSCDFNISLGILIYTKIRINKEIFKKSTYLTISLLIKSSNQKRTNKQKRNV